MNRLKQAGLIVVAMCVGCILLIGSAWMAERSAAQSYGPAVGNAPAGPGKNQPSANIADDFPDNSPEVVRPEPKPIPDGESVWEDYDDIQDSPRFKDRPGNYGALKALDDFLDGQQQLRPDLRGVAFPFYFDSSTPIKDKSEWEAKLAEREKQARKEDRKIRNEFRSINMFVKELKLIDIPDLSKLPQEEIDKLVSEDKSKSVLDRLPLVTKEHKGAAVLIRMKIHLESLVSDKVKGNEAGDYFWFLVVRVESGWRLAYYDD